MNRFIFIIQIITSRLVRHNNYYRSQTAYVPTLHIVLQWIFMLNNTVDEMFVVKQVSFLVVLLKLFIKLLKKIKRQIASIKLIIITYYFPEKLIGARHVQSLMLFLCLTLAYAFRVNMSVAIVAITDKDSPDVSIIFQLF